MMPSTGTDQHNHISRYSSLVGALNDTSTFAEKPRNDIMMVFALAKLVLYLRGIESIAAIAAAPQPSQSGATIGPPLTHYDLILVFESHHVLLCPTALYMHTHTCTHTGVHVCIHVCIYWQGEQQCCWWKYNRGFREICM